MTDPISPAYHERMNALARALSELLKPAGFALLVFDMNRIEGGRVNYISNAERASMLAAMKEFIARAEGRVHETETKQ